MTVSQTIYPKRQAENSQSLEQTSHSLAAYADKTIKTLYISVVVDVDELEQPHEYSYDKTSQTLSIFIYDWTYWRPMDRNALNHIVSAQTNLEKVIVGCTLGYSEKTLEFSQANNPEGTRALGLMSSTDNDLLNCSFKSFLSKASTFHAICDALDIAWVMNDSDELFLMLTRDQAALKENPALKMLHINTKKNPFVSRIDEFNTTRAVLEALIRAGHAYDAAFFTNEFARLGDACVSDGIFEHQEVLPHLLRYYARMNLLSIPSTLQTLMLRYEDLPINDSFHKFFSVDEGGTKKLAFDQFIDLDNDAYQNLLHTLFDELKSQSRSKFNLLPPHESVDDASKKASGSKL